jgi:hypothetical protein
MGFVMDWLKGVVAAGAGAGAGLFRGLPTFLLHRRVRAADMVIGIGLEHGTTSHHDTGNRCQDTQNQGGQN